MIKKEMQQRMHRHIQSQRMSYSKQQLLLLLAIGVSNCKVPLFAWHMMTLVSLKVVYK